MENWWPNSATTPHSSATTSGTRAARASSTAPSPLLISSPKAARPHAGPATCHTLRLPTFPSPTSRRFTPVRQDVMSCENGIEPSRYATSTRMMSPGFIALPHQQLPVYPLLAFPLGQQDRSLVVGSLAPQPLRVYPGIAWLFCSFDETSLIRSVAETG